MDCRKVLSPLLLSPGQGKGVAILGYFQLIFGHCCERYGPNKKESMYSSFYYKCLQIFAYFLKAEKSIGTNSNTIGNVSHHYSYHTEKR